MNPNTVHRLGRLVTVLLACLPGAAPIDCSSRHGSVESPLPHRPMGLLALPGVPEPSGLAFHPGRGTLFVVDDGGILCEFDHDGNVLHIERIRRADFEGVAVDPASGLLAVAIEGVDAILEVDPSTFEIRGEHALPRSFRGETMFREGGQGIEGITFVREGTVLVANQGADPGDPSVIVEADLPTSRRGTLRIVRAFRPDVEDISALHYDADRDVVLAVSDARDLLMAFSRRGDFLASWGLPGADQEGIAVDGEGVLYIAQDAGGVLKLEVDWDWVLGPMTQADTLDSDS